MVRRMRLGEKISRLRAGRPYAEVARAIGCSAPTVREIESGKTANPRVGLVCGLAGHFGVSLDWLADDDADWPPPESSRDRAAAMVERALSGSGLAGELADEERELLAYFRILPPGDQREVSGYVRGLVRAVAGRELSGEAAFEYERALRQILDAGARRSTSPSRRRVQGVGDKSA